MSRSLKKAPLPATASVINDISAPPIQRAAFTIGGIMLPFPYDRSLAARLAP